MAARRKVGKGKAAKRSTRKNQPSRPPVASRKPKKAIDPEPEYTIIEQTSAVKSPPSASDPEPGKLESRETLRPAENRKKEESALAEDSALELLTTRRRRFVEEYLICGNATKAAELAGYSANRADVEGSELLKDPIVAGIIARREADMYKRLGITQERIFTEKAAIALADLGEVFTERTDGMPMIRPLSQWSPAVRKAIKSIKVKRHDAIFTDTRFEPAYDILELSLWDKPAALDKIEARLESDHKRGQTAETLTEAQRIRKIAEILSRGKAALEASKKTPARKKSA